MPKLCKALESLKEELPPIFAGTKLDELTGGGYVWRTLQNEKSLGIAPEGVFQRAGKRKLLVVRDAFLEYWQAKIDSASAYQV